MVLAVSRAVADAAFPDVSCSPEVFTPGRSILAVPSKETPPMVLAVARAVAVAAFPLHEEAVPAFPFKSAVIVPALKFPLEFLTTILEAKFVEDAGIIAEFSKLRDDLIPAAVFL
jgi:hypothetical protein